MGGDNNNNNNGGGYYDNNNNGAGYGAYSQQPAGAPTYGESSVSSSYTYGAGGGGPSGSGSGSAGDPAGAAAMLRRRNIEKNDSSYNDSSSNRRGGSGGNFVDNPFQKRVVVKNLDFMFPKVDTEFTVQTERGGMAFCVAVFLIVVLCMAETVAWISLNSGASSTKQHVVVDTSLGQQMRVYLNITFPALACEDLHVDIMDVAGDSQLNVENSMTKTKLTLDGRITGRKQKVESNAKRREQENTAAIQKIELPADYCGPCYGAQVNETQPCCNTCDDLLDAYNQSSEQCIRENRHKQQPKLMTRGQGCNLVGYFTLNRVAGNFHIAMGEGIERDGRHVHTFQPDDTPNFNASHIIHHLSFGSISQTALQQEQEQAAAARRSSSGATADAERAVALQVAQASELLVPQPLNGVRKIVEKKHGTTGLFQYFIKVVPTTVVTSKKKKSGGEASSGSQNKETRETNGYFFTERFRPLMLEYYNDDHFDTDADNADNNSTDPNAVVPAGATGSSSSNHEHHDVKKNSILPGVFFIYEIYPFSVQITSVQVPWTHLLIRIMATIGGVLTIVKWVDFTFFERMGGCGSGGRQNR
jgi:endoplasmic reticulum-Golgi intermediate compartment protein 3